MRISGFTKRFAVASALCSGLAASSVFGQGIQLNTTNQEKSKALGSMFATGTEQLRVRRSNAGTLQIEAPAGGHIEIDEPRLSKTNHSNELSRQFADSNIRAVQDENGVLKLRSKLSLDWNQMLKQLNDNSVAKFNKISEQFRDLETYKLKLFSQTFDSNASRQEIESQIKKLTNELGELLLEIAASSDEKSNVVAAKGYAILYDDPTSQLQAAAVSLGMKTMDYRQTQELVQAAQSVGRIFRGTDYVGVCTKISSKSCVTAQHVVKDLNADALTDWTVRYDVEGKEIRLKINSAKNIVANRDIGTLKFDCASLLIDGANLTDELKVKWDQIPCAKLASSRQDYLHQSLHQVKFKRDNDEKKELQFNCSILCPSALEKSDREEVRKKLIERSIIDYSLQKSRSENWNIWNEKSHKELLQAVDKFIEDNYQVKAVQVGTQRREYLLFTVTDGGKTNFAAGYHASTFKGDSGSPLFALTTDGAVVAMVHLGATSEDRLPRVFGAHRLAWGIPADWVNANEIP